MKKILLGVATGIAGLVSVLPAFATGTYITLPASSTQDLFAYAGGIFSDLWVLIAVAIGIPLAFYVIKKVIGLIPKR